MILETLEVPKGRVQFWIREFGARTGEYQKKDRQWFQTKAFVQNAKMHKHLLRLAPFKFLTQ